MTTQSIRILLIGAAFAAACLGDAVFTFQTLPANGAIQGSPGDTIGWGYTIENQSSSDFLVLTNLDAGSFFNGTATGLFDFPILAPGDSVTESFTADTQGLYELTWDASAPVGFTNTGSFTVTADWYDADPSSGGAPIEGLTGVQMSAPYSAEVVAGEAAIPEPKLVAPFLAVLLGLMIWLRRVRGPLAERAEK